MKRQLYILSGILVILSLYVYFFEIKKAEQELKKKQKEESILSVSKDNIKVIEIVNEYTKIKLHREKDIWYIDNNRADKLIVKNILEELGQTYKTLIYSGNLTKNQKENFGISNIAIKLNNNENLFFGFKTPVGLARYAYNTKLKKLFTLSDTIYSYINKPLREFRDKTISSCNAMDIIDIVYSKAGKNLHFIKDTKTNTWRIENKDTYKTTEAFLNFKNLLCSLLASDFPKKLKYNKTGAKITFKLKSSTSTTFRLFETKYKKLLKKEDLLFEISDYDYSTLNKDFSKLIEKKKEKKS